MSQRDTGTHYENQARHYLERAGLVFKAANVTYQNGEIDLIMRDGDTWVFVEVRFRRNALFGGAAASVTYSKQQRLLRGPLPFGWRSETPVLPLHRAVLMFLPSLVAS